MNNSPSSCPKEFMLHSCPQSHISYILAFAKSIPTTKKAIQFPLLWFIMSAKHLLVNSPNIHETLLCGRHWQGHPHLYCSNVGGNPRPPWEACILGNIRVNQHYIFPSSIPIFQCFWGGNLNTVPQIMKNLLSFHWSYIFLEFKRDLANLWSYSFKAVFFSSFPWTFTYLWLFACLLFPIIPGR